MLGTLFLGARLLWFRMFQARLGNHRHEGWQIKWWGCLDLNQGPIGYEPTALTTELHPRVCLPLKI